MKPFHWTWKWVWLQELVAYQRGEVLFPPCDDVLCESRYHYGHPRKMLPPQQFVTPGWQECPQGCGLTHRIDNPRPFHSHVWLNGEYAGMRVILDHMALKHQWVMRVAEHALQVAKHAVSLLFESDS